MTSHPNPGSVAVGIDGSPSALRAVRWAAGVAVRDGVPLRLVHERKSEFVPFETTGCAGDLPGSQLTVRTVRAGSVPG